MIKPHHTQGASAPLLDTSVTQPIHCAFSVAPGLAPEDRLALARHLRHRLDLLDQHWPGGLIAIDHDTLEQALMAGQTFQRLADLLEEGLPTDQAAPDGRPRLSVLMAIDASADLTEEQRIEASAAMARQHQAMADLRKAMIEAERMPCTSDSALNRSMAAMANDLYDLRDALSEAAPVHVNNPEATLRLNAAGEVEALNAHATPFSRADYHRPSRARALVHVTHAGRVVAEPLKPSEQVIDLDNPIDAAKAATFASPHAATAMLHAAAGRLGFDAGQVLSDLISEFEAETYGRHLNEVPAYRQAIHLLDAMGHRHASPFAERVRADEGQPLA